MEILEFQKNHGKKIARILKENPGDSTTHPKNTGVITVISGRCDPPAIG